MKVSDNNNDAITDLSAVDPHGHAALQLTESLMHSLIDSSAIDLDEAKNIVSIAIDATEEQADNLPTRPQSLDESISLLTDIRHSMGGCE
jgi:hypothetical protein